MPGKKPRFSIARLMVIVSILAAECGLLRAIRDNVDEVHFIFLPTLNFMLLGLPKLKRGHEARPFWIGFEVTSMILVGLLWLLIWYSPDVFYYQLKWPSDNQWIYAEGGVILSVFCVVAILGLPQLVAASMVGWLSARYRIVIERRPRASDAWGPPIEGSRRSVFRDLPGFGESPRPAVE